MVQHFQHLLLKEGFVALSLFQVCKVCRLILGLLHPHHKPYKDVPFFLQLLSVTCDYDKTHLRMVLLFSSMHNYFFLRKIKGYVINRSKKIVVLPQLIIKLFKREIHYLGILMINSFIW